MLIALKFRFQNKTKLVGKVCKAEATHKLYLSFLKAGGYYFTGSVVTGGPTL